MINRQVQPAILPIEEIEFLAPLHKNLGNGVFFYHTKEVQNDTTRLDLYFEAGKITSKNGIAGIVNGLLLSGTAKKTSFQIDEEIDGLGGFYESGVSMENAVVSIFCLRENLSQIVDILIDAICHVSFDEKEVKQFLNDRKQKLKISKEKVNVLSQRRFQQELFASNEDYASVTEEKDLENISIESLKSYHEKHYKKGLSKIVLVGNVEESIVNHILILTKDMLCDSLTKNATQISSNIGQFTEKKKDAIQSAIRLGRILFNKNHPDYPDFLVLNTILGDYFGSRLMSNIREDKGYTYGIGSAVAEFENIGYFVIVTEVGTDVMENTMKEIQIELKRLQEELVGEEELETVKNYMLGQLLKSADGPYAMMDLFLSAEAQHKSLDFYNDVIDQLNAITPKRIQELAIKYLNWEDFTIVTAG